MLKKILLAAVLLCGAANVLAGAEGRYQAIPIDPGEGYGAEKALILDSVSGHLWIWIESPTVDDDPGGRFLIYQGQLVPGRKMGDIIEKQEWPAKPAKDTPPALKTDALPAPRQKAR
ncbi:MAG: hypothetical protein IT492_18840 [Gammaproteobacteria bacterium]|nr:hypothetical protein [Gammaproteobacteria bacterium]